MTDALTAAAAAAMLTREQAIILTGFTGVILCDIDDFLVDLNRRIPREKPFTLHDLHQETFETAIKPAYAADCQALLPVDWMKESRREETFLAAADAADAGAASAQPKIILPH